MSPVDEQFLVEVRELLGLGLGSYGGFAPPEDEFPDEHAAWARDHARASDVATTILAIIQAHTERLDGQVARRAYDRALTLLADLVAALPAERTVEARAFLAAQP